jgi:hypothetical protein
MAGSCEYGNETSGFVKAGNFLTSRVIGSSQKGLYSITIISGILPHAVLVRRVREMKV